MEPFTAVAQTRYGPFLYNRNDQIIGRSLDLYGEYSQGEVELLCQLVPPGSIVVDAGANIGAITVPLAMHVGERGYVYAFEPQRIVFQALCGNVSVHSLTNVDCIPAALGAQREMIHIPDIDYAREANFGGMEIAQFSGGRPVEQHTLDEYLDRGPFALIKIDVEGMELDVIRGGRRVIEAHRPILYVEFDRIEKNDALLAELRSLDYRIFRHNPLIFNPANFKKNANNVFGDSSFVNVMCIPRERDANIAGFVEL